MMSADIQMGQTPRGQTRCKGGFGQWIGMHRRHSCKLKEGRRLSHSLPLSQNTLVHQVVELQ
jgi:hypothetical protein